MRINLFVKKSLLLFVIFLIASLFSCKKDGKLSPDFDNGNLSIVFIDTLSLQSTVVKDIPSTTQAISYHLLGVYHDPIFGVKSSSIYTNVGLVGATDFGDSLTVDSLVLSLSASQFYGNNNSTYTVNLFELSNPLSGSSIYKSNTYTPIENTLLGSASFSPNDTDEILQVTIKEPTLLSKISNQSVYSSTADFNNVFKGLHIVTSDTAGGSPAINQGEGFLATLYFNSSDSKIKVFYRNGVSSTKTQDLVVNSDVKTYSRFINDYTGTDIEKHLANDPAKNQNRIYVSDMEGLRTKIEVPYLKNLSNNGNISINKAEIIFTVESGSDATPDEILQAITLANIDANGNILDLVDDFSGAAHFGGVFDLSTKSIRFNITRHLQQIITGVQSDNGMYLTSNPIIVVPNRTVFNSENSPTLNAKIELTYSKL
ncbi:MAG: DUF4270 family protein [Vicingaceae bacterium]